MAQRYPAPAPAPDPSRDTADDPKEPLLDWTRVIGGALAAVSSAVLLSTLGSAGTIVGAALGSIVVSVSSTLYAHGLKRSRRKMAQAQELALRRVGVAQAEVHRARRRTAAGATDAHLERADEHLAEAHEELDNAATSGSLRDRLAELPWKRVALVAGLMFVIAIAAITIFELVGGRPVSSYTGGTSSHQGTSLSNLRHSGNNSDSPLPSPSPTTPSPSSSIGTSPSPSPSSTPSETPSSTPSSSPSPSETPTDQPTPSLSATPTH
jgi:hypothetical protein